jgi:ABC-type polar amino acid transport system ATPase subunit
MMDRGSIVEEGSPAEIFTSAGSDRTRRFLQQLTWEDT